MSPTASILLSLSVSLLCGLLLSRLAKRIQLPAVTAYLIAGVLIGPFVPGALHIPGIGITVEQMEGFVGPFLTKVALTKAGDIKEEGRRSARDEHLAKKALNK